MLIPSNHAKYERYPESLTSIGKKLGVSRQRAWQILRENHGVLCPFCNRPKFKAGQCRYHYLQQVLWTRQRRWKSGKVRQRKPYRCLYGTEENLKRLIKEAKYEQGIGEQSQG